MSLTGNSTLVTTLAGARDTAVADSGGMYTAITPTPGTGIVGGAAVTTFDQTKPHIILYNSGNLNIYPLYIRAHTTVVGVGNSIANWTFTLDTGNLYTSGGTALTINNTNMLSANKSAAIITVGATTCAAATGAARIVGHQMVRAALEVVHDCLQFNFGGAEQCDPMSLIGNSTTISHTTVNFAPLVIGPGQCFKATRWAGSQSTGVTLELEMCYIEK
jgi:hypothetical protein